MRLKLPEKDANSIYLSDHYPLLKSSSRVTKYSKYNYNVLLGVGGNVGDMVRRFEHLYFFLVQSPYLCIVETSPILKNPPFGYYDQSDFYNATIHIKTFLSPREILRYVLKVEKLFGRVRSFANAPRTLDIDIIFYENREINREDLVLPHPHWSERDSVLIPLKKMKGIRWLKRHL